jgi:hypothetical protein
MDLFEVGRAKFSIQFIARECLDVMDISTKKKFFPKKVQNFPTIPEKIYSNLPNESKAPGQPKKPKIFSRIFKCKHWVYHVLNWHFQKQLYSKIQSQSF